MRRAAIFLAALALAPGASACRRNGPPDAPTRQQTSVTIPFHPPLGREIRYELTEQKTEDGRATTTTILFSVEFAAHGDGYRMVVREAASARVPAGAPPMILLLSPDGRIAGLENRDALLAFQTDRIERGPSPPGIDRAWALRIARTILVLTLSGDATAGLYAPVLAMAGARLATGRTVSRPIIFYEEFGATILPWRVTLQRVDGSVATISAEAGLDRDQAAARYDTLARRFRDEAGEPLPASIGWRSPASAEHYVERARATWRVSLRDGLVNAMEAEEIRERRDPGDAMSRNVEHRTLRRLP